MRKFRIPVTLMVLLFALSSQQLFAQVISGGSISGTVLNNGAPVSDVQVIFTNVDTNRQFKTKTDKRGEYIFAVMPGADYKVEITNDKKEVLYTNLHVSIQAVDTSSVPPIDLSRPEASGGFAGAATPAPPAKKLTKEEIAKIKAENEKLSSLNSLIIKFQSARQAQNWKEAEDALKQVLAAVPDTSRWEFFQALGETQSKAGDFQDATQTFEKGIQVAQQFVSGSLPPDPKVPSADPAKAKTGIGQMLTSEGNAWFNLKNLDKAAELYGKAAEMSPAPAVAYYNLCAIQFNNNNLTAAVAACEKSIAADPAMANPWFIKGSVLYKGGKTENGKYVAPQGTAEALNKYLELAPNGEHAAEAKTLLQIMGK
ncbi:MAG TPA: carboxypeptidase regulatory-like domain-containing protein [Candidatus Angelobacter sp.]|nr:carboxypeptidase regulatory-like domain-containing protein [Candidatus Angelobacter sp.]